MPSQKSGMLIPAMTNPSVGDPPAGARLAAEDAERDADERRQHHRQERQLERHGQRRGEQRRERGAGHVVLAEVAVEQAAEPAGVLGEQRPVEAEVGADHGDVLRRGAEAEHRPHRVARDEVDEQEHEHAEREQHRDRDQHAAGDEQPARSLHRLAAVSPSTRGADAAEHRLGEPEVLGGEAGGELGVAVDDRLDQRRVLFERPPAQAPASTARRGSRARP